MTITKDAPVLVVTNGTHPLVQMGLIPATVVEGRAVTTWETSDQVMERLLRDAPDEVAKHAGDTPMPSVLVNAPADETGRIVTYLCVDLGTNRSVEHLQNLPLVGLIEEFNADDPKWETKIPDALTEEDLKNLA